jgi:hypothetical protein
VSVPVLIKLALEYCARSFNPGVAPTVTPPAAATVVCPAPIEDNEISVPMSKATDELSGTVMVLGDALDIVINSPASPIASVYEAVFSLIVIVVGTEPVAPVAPVAPVEYDTLERTTSQTVPFHFQMRLPTVCVSLTDGEFGKSIAGISAPYFMYVL